MFDTTEAVVPQGFVLGPTLFIIIHYIYYRYRKGHYLV
jgi:hypothetical protein